MMRGCALVLCVLATGCGVEKSLALLACPPDTRLVNDRCVGSPDGGMTDGGELDGGMSPVLISPTNLDFGAVPVGGRQTLQIDVFNPGSSTAVLRWGDFGTNLLQSPVENQELVLPPQGRSTVVVAFTPNQAGITDARWSVQTCEAGCEQIIVIQGRGTQTQGNPLFCEPLDFGPVEIGSCANAVIYCFNASVRPLAVENISMDSPESIFVDGPFQQFIPPEGDLLISMAFCPDRPGPQVARVTIDLQDVDVPATVEVRGTGGDGPPSECELQFSRTIDFGAQPPFAAAGQELIFTNFGSQQCSAQVRLLGPDAQYFLIPRDRRLTIPPGQDRRLQLQFTGADVGSYQATLEVDVSNEDGATRTDQIQLQATVVSGSNQLISTCQPTAYVSAPANPQPIQWMQNPDDGFAIVPIPFAFTLFGRQMTEVFVSTNGFVTFHVDEARSLTNTQLPDTRTPNQLVAWWWDDLDPGASGPSSATTSIEGPMGQRMLRIRFTDLSPFGDNQTTINAEVRLVEGDDSVQVFYGDLVNGPTPRGFNASVGWDGPNGLVGEDVLGCSPRCSATNWPAATMCTYSDAP